VRIERLPAVTADARVYDPDKPAGDTNQSFDPDFAKAAYALQPGQISEPAKSSFGYHVIFGEVRLPAARMPLEQRRQLLRDDVIKGRAEHAKQELLASLSAAQPIPISRAADDLTARVQVAE
jgi:peptidyl-prolyl cis-trans isomerase C